MSEVFERVAVETVPLGELLIDIRNGLVVEQEKESPGIPITRIETISKGTVDMDRVRYVRDAAGKNLENFWLKKGDILFSHINSNLHLGKTALVVSDVPLLHGMNLLRLRVDSSRLRPKYLHHWLDYCRRTGVFMAIAQHAVNQSSLNQKKITSLEVPLCSIEQQDEIVAEIEKQFSRLDDAVANLQRVKANLKRYKASILKAAVEGRLVETEASIAQREGRSFETGEQLLQRILEDRQAQAKGKRVELNQPDPDELPDCPEGWSWTTCDAAINIIDAGASFKCEERSPVSGEVGVLKVSALTWGTYDENESKTCKDDRRIEEKYLVRDGDFLFSRANTIELVGASVIVGKTTKLLMLSDKTLRFKLDERVLPGWLQICLHCKFGRDDIERLATGNQVSMRNIGQERIRQIRMPMPPFSEQKRSVGEVDRHLSIIREVEAEVDANFQRALALRQAALIKLFN